MFLVPSSLSLSLSDWSSGIINHLGFGLVWNSSWDWKAWFDLWSITYYSGTRWLGLQWWEIDDMRGLYSGNVQRGGCLSSYSRVHSSYWVHRKYLAPYFRLILFLTPYAKTSFSRWTFSYHHHHYTWHLLFFATVPRFGMHICWRFLRITEHAYLVGATMRLISYRSARFLAIIKWNCHNTTS